MNNRGRNIKLVILVVLIFFIAVQFSSFFLIHRQVKATCLLAKSRYSEDCVSSLIKFAEAEEHTFRERNSAVWALGQIADKKALPLLYRLSESLPEQEKCSYDKYLCKYEVEKAIKWCEKGNVTSWMYRNRDEWE